MTISNADLLAYLDEVLPEARAVEIERLVRESSLIRQQLATLLQQRDQGGHTLGEIWRRHQLSCISRHDFARYLKGQLSASEREYLEFHLHQIQCTICLANWEDLRSLSNESADDPSQRRRRFFESSAGGLRKSDG